MAGSCVPWIHAQLVKSFSSVVLACGSTATFSKCFQVLDGVALVVQPAIAAASVAAVAIGQ